MGDPLNDPEVPQSNRKFYQLEYYKYNRFFMGLAGQWPYSPRWQKRLGTAFYLFSLGHFLTLEIVYIIKSTESLGQVIDCVAGIVVNSVVFMKLATLAIEADSVKAFFTAIQDDWNTVNGSSERQILQHYANKSRSLTFGFMVYMYGSLFEYLLIPAVPIIMDRLIPLENGTRLRLLPSHIEYFIEDPMEHYALFYLHQSISIFNMLTMVITIDSTFITFVQHVCGSFALLKYKLDHLTDDDELAEDFHASRENSRVYAKLVVCIHDHWKAIEFAERIESAYYIPNLFEIVLSVTVISIVGVQAIVNIDEKVIASRFAVGCTALALHIFFIVLPGQALYDHSSSVFEAAYNCNWCLISKESRALLRIIMLRSSKACSLTAGKLFALDFPRYASIVQTSVSYFAVLTSMH